MLSIPNILKHAFMFCVQSWLILAQLSGQTYTVSWWVSACVLSWESLACPNNSMLVLRDQKLTSAPQCSVDMPCNCDWGLGCLSVFSWSSGSPSVLDLPLDVITEQSETRMSSGCLQWILVDLIFLCSPQWLKLIVDVSSLSAMSTGYPGSLVNVTSSFSFSWQPSGQLEYFFWMFCVPLFLLSNSMCSQSLWLWVLLRIFLRKFTCGEFPSSTFRFALGTP